MVHNNFTIKEEKKMNKTDLKVDNYDLKLKDLSYDNLYVIINNNISFVEKYINKVDDVDSDIDKEIMYRELGVITLSSIEALAKAIMVEINKKCKNNKCHKKCDYRWCKKCIRNSSLKSILIHLNETRLVSFSQNKINELARLIDLRNYVHLSKYLEEEKQKIEFNYRYVDNILEFYHEFYNHFIAGYSFFKQEDCCLKDHDEEGFEDTKRMNGIDEKVYLEKELRSLFDKLLHNAALSQHEEWILANISKKEYQELELDDLVSHMAFNFARKAHYVHANNIEVDDDRYNDIVNIKMKALNLDEKIKEEIKKHYYGNK